MRLLLILRHNDEHEVLNNVMQALLLLWTDDFWRVAVSLISLILGSLLNYLIAHDHVLLLDGVKFVDKNDLNFLHVSLDVVIQLLHELRLFVGDEHF